MKLCPIQQPAQFQWMIFCPGCKCGHGLRVGQSDGPPSWKFNEDMEKPTFTPSLLVTGLVYPPVDPATGDFRRGSDGEYLFDDKGRVLGSRDSRCHSYIIDGRIQFLGDCTHELAGQTVDLPDF